MSVWLASPLILRENSRCVGPLAGRRPMGATMGSVRFGSLILLASLLAACSHHPVTIGPVSTTPTAPVRPLLETPPPADVPVPPTPELKPGTEISLERLRSVGDADIDLSAVAALNATPDTTAAPVTQASAIEPAPTQTPQATSVANPPAADSTTTASTDDDPDHLVGLSEADAVRLLGNPKTRADTPPSRVWTYTSTSCDLRLFFYPEIGGTSYRTLTYEIDDRDPTDSTRRNCVGGLLKNHAG